MQNQQKPLFKISNMKKYYPIKGGILKRVQGHVKAVEDVTIDVYEGETLGVERIWVWKINIRPCCA